MSQVEKNAISLTRVFATVLILCCHLVPCFNNAILQMSAQFFNVGVSVFLILSGYLYGKRKITDKCSYKEWLINRCKRILIPLYLFLIILLCIYIVKGIRVKIFNWLIYVFNLQAIEIYINGGEHLWYLTIAMVCYFVTIILDKQREKLDKKNITILMVSIVIIQLIISYMISSQLGNYMLYIELYIVAYFAGIYWNSNKISIKYFFCFLVLSIVSAIIRIGTRIVFDDTILYNVIIVGYTQAIIGFSIFFIIFYLVSKVRRNLNFELIKYFDSISYEIYLVHYMFIVGPVGLMNITRSVLVNCLIVIICSYIVAVILHKTNKTICKIDERYLDVTSMFNRKGI